MIGRAARRHRALLAVTSHQPTPDRGHRTVLPIHQQSNGLFLQRSMRDPQPCGAIFERQGDPLGVRRRSLTGILMQHARGSHRL